MVEGKFTLAQTRVPVIDVEGKPLMPCTAAKARILIKRGWARPRWSKLGIFYIQLTFSPKPPVNANQKLVIGMDPGSSLRGYLSSAQRTPCSTSCLKRLIG